MNCLADMADIVQHSKRQVGKRSLTRWVTKCQTTAGITHSSSKLQLEIDRIPTRNLGRDDRVISSWGKETRHPFLSLSVVNFLARLPVHLKLDPRLEAGVGEKLLLRLAARKVGLVEASGRKKRAMQFGSHSARMAPGDNDRKGDISLDDR